MGNTRRLNEAEKFGGWGSEKARDRAEARRAIEGLEQNDQIIAVLGELVAEQRRTNQLLQWFADRAHAEDASK